METLVVGTKQIQNCLADIGILEDGKDVAVDASLFDLGLLDSLGFMKLIAELQARFDIRVPELDLLPDYFDSVNAIVAYVNRRKHEVVAN